MPAKFDMKGSWYHEIPISNLTNITYRYDEQNTFKPNITLSCSVHIIIDHHIILHCGGHFLFSVKSSLFQNLVPLESLFRRPIVRKVSPTAHCWWQHIQLWHFSVGKMPCHRMSILIFSLLWLSNAEQIVQGGGTSCNASFSSSLSSWFDLTNCWGGFGRWWKIQQVRWSLCSTSSFPRLPEVSVGPHWHYLKDGTALESFVCFRFSHVRV